MGFFTKKINNQQKGKLSTMLAIDIGTYAAKVVVFHQQGNQIEILGYGKALQPNSAMDRALIMNKEEVVDTVDKAIGQAVSQAMEHFDDLQLPKQAIVGVAGELVAGVPVIVNVEREDPNEAVSESEIKHLIKKIKEHTFESTIEDVAEEIGYVPEQITEIDTYVDSIYLDSLKVQNPVGLRGSLLKCKVFSTFSPKVHFDSITNIITSLGLEIAGMVVEPYAVAISTESIRKSSNDGAIFIDIGGGTTDVALMDHGEIIGTKMYAIGGKSFTKRIAKSFNISDLEAEKKKIDYTSQKLSGEENSQIHQILSLDIELWLSGLLVSLEEFEDVLSLPSQIYICGGGALLPDVMEALLAYPWKSQLPFAHQPKVSFLYPNKVANVVDFARSVIEISDVAPIALARTTLEF